MGQGTSVYIIGKEDGWFHVVYNTSEGQRSGYVPTNTVINITGGTPEEEDFWGGYCRANVNQTVYSCDDSTKAISIGSVYAGEGVTRLYGYDATSSTGTSYPVIFIEYSTSSGAKRGYIYNPNFAYPHNTCVGKMTAGCNVYYGFDNFSCFDGYTFAKSGFVGAGECISIIGKKNSRLLIEYNTPDGRKRGSIQNTYVRFYHAPSVFDKDAAFSSGSVEIDLSNPKTVYAGPSTAYPVIGSTDAGETVYVCNNNKDNGYRLIQYRVNGSNTLKSGYIYLPNF